MDPCGQVSGGYIKIRGPVKIATCEPSYGTMHHYDYNLAAMLSPKRNFDDNIVEVHQAQEELILGIVWAFSM